MQSSSEDHAASFKVEAEKVEAIPNGTRQHDKAAAALCDKIMEIAPHLNARSITEYYDRASTQCDRMQKTSHEFFPQAVWRLASVLAESTTMPSSQRAQRFDSLIEKVGAMPPDPVYYHRETVAHTLFTALGKCDPKEIARGSRLAKCIEQYKQFLPDRIPGAGDVRGPSFSALGSVLDKLDGSDITPEYIAFFKEENATLNKSDINQSVYQAEAKMGTLSETYSHEGFAPQSDSPNHGQGR